MTIKEKRKAFYKALRSKKYEQGMGALRSIDGEHCCLGVACDVYRNLTGKGKWKCDGDDYYFVLGKNIDYSLLPRTVAKFYGFTEEGFACTNPDIGGRSATFYNDQVGSNFRDIADLFEAAYPST